MRLLVVSDTHEQVRELEQIISSETNVDFILNLGDLRNDRNLNLPADYGYKDYGLPTYFIKGNHDTEEVIKGLENGTLRINNFSIIKPGEVIRLRKGDDMLRVAGLGGNYSPSTYLQKRKNTQTRYFIDDDVEKSKALGADIFLSHECPLALGLTNHKGQNVGVQAIDDIVEAVKPALFISGHHHRYMENRVRIDGKEITLIGLERPKQSYVLIDYAFGKFSIQRKHFQKI